MSISTEGDARRSFMSGSSEWPPASSLASSPYSASRLTASSARLGPLVVEGRRDHAGVPTLEPALAAARMALTMLW